MSIYQSIQDFISLALQNGTIEPLDELYHRNQLLHFLGLNLSELAHIFTAPAQGPDSSQIPDTQTGSHGGPEKP